MEMMLGPQMRMGYIRDKFSTVATIIPSPDDIFRIWCVYQVCTGLKTNDKDYLQRWFIYFDGDCGCVLRHNLLMFTSFLKLAAL